MAHGSFIGLTVQGGIIVEHSGVERTTDPV